MSPRARDHDRPGRDCGLMTSHTYRSPVRARPIVMVMGTVATALALTACGDAQQQATPSPSASSVSPTPTNAPTTTQPTVIGKLSVLIALTTPDSVVPQPPLTYTLVIREPASGIVRPYPVSPDGTFAIALPPGTYEVSHLGIEAAELGPDPFGVPLKTNSTDPRIAEHLVLRVPATGCLYGGEVDVVYGRLPAVSEKKQDALVAQASKNNNEKYGYVYRPDGGFVMAGASVSMPAQADRPVAAQSCTAEKFGWVAA